ncbi:hypothetical protein K438DRAFT_2000864 [Mycena galopus ATCC 62051]|nr:hypothetical protein K438DRAFT_2000864 [Mycena galopus ATCC 62051]
MKRSTSALCHSFTVEDVDAPAFLLSLISHTLRKALLRTRTPDSRDGATALRTLHAHPSATHARHRTPISVHARLVRSMHRTPRAFADPTRHVRPGGVLCVAPHGFPVSVAPSPPCTQTRLRTIDYSANTRTPAAVCTPRSSVTYAHPPRLYTPCRRPPAVRPPRPHVHRLHTPRPHDHRHRLRTPRSSVYYAHPLLYARPVRTHMSIAITCTRPAWCARRTHGRHPATVQRLPSKFGAATAAHVRRLRTPTAMRLQKTSRSSAAFLRHEAEVVSAPLVRSLRTPTAVRMPAARLSTARPTRLSTTHTLPPTRAQFGVLDSEQRDIAPTC